MGLLKHLRINHKDLFEQLNVSVELFLQLDHRFAIEHSLFQVTQDLVLLRIELGLLDLSSPNMKSNRLYFCPYN